MSARRVAIFVLSLGLLIAGTDPWAGHAQQVLVDDPTSVQSGAAQLEAWHSPEESWIAPAMRVHPRLELAAGVAFLGTGVEDRRTVEYSVESKVLVRPGTTHRLGAAMVGERASASSASSAAVRPPSTATAS